MKLERLRITASNVFPWGEITDIDTGEQIPNVSRVEVVIDANERPKVLLTIHTNELVIETDETVSPKEVVHRIRNKTP